MCMLLPFTDLTSLAKLLTTFTVSILVSISLHRYQQSRRDAKPYCSASVNASDNTEYNLISLPNSTNIATYVTTTRNIGLENVGGPLVETPLQPLSVWTDSIPYRHIASASFQDSNVVYTYYQVNDTTIAELQYNLDSGIWKVDFGSLSIVVDGT